MAQHSSWTDISLVYKMLLSINVQAGVNNLLSIFGNCTLLSPLPRQIASDSFFCWMTSSSRGPALFWGDEWEQQHKFSFLHLRHLAIEARGDITAWIHGGKQRKRAPSWLREEGGKDGKQSFWVCYYGDCYFACAGETGKKPTTGGGVAGWGWAATVEATPG